MLEALFASSARLTRGFQYSGPGLRQPVTGDMESGYFGELTESEFLSINEFLEQLGLIGGVGEVISSITWVKVYYNEKVLFIPKTPVGTSISWSTLYRLGLVHGTEDEGPYLVDRGVIQNKEVRVGDDFFKVRLFRGANTDPFSTSEDDIGIGLDEFSMVLGKITNVSYPTLPGPKWHNYSTSALGNRVELVQESVELDLNKVITRQVANESTTQVDKSYESHYWRPVLELITEDFRSPVFERPRYNGAIFLTDEELLQSAREVKGHTLLEYVAGFASPGSLEVVEYLPSPLVLSDEDILNAPTVQSGSTLIDLVAGFSEPTDLTIVSYLPRALDLSND